MAEEAGNESVTGVTDIVGDEGTPGAGDAGKKRGRKPGSRVKVKGGTIRVSGPRKPKVSHGWYIRTGISTNGNDRWVSEVALAAKSVKTALRESKDIMAQFIANNPIGPSSKFIYEMFEIKHRNMDVRSVPQKPKVVL